MCVFREKNRGTPWTIHIHTHVQGLTARQAKIKHEMCVMVEAVCLYSAGSSSNRLIQSHLNSTLLLCTVGVLIAAESVY